MNSEITKQSSSLPTEKYESDPDYIQYTIAACKQRGTKNLTNHRFKTATEVLISYKESNCYIGDRPTRNRKIVSYLQDLLNEHLTEESRFDSDSLHIIRRCRHNILAFNTYEDIFNALSDYLWLIASIHKTGNSGAIHLLRRFNVESIAVIGWIDDFYLQIQKAKYDLSCMQEAKRLPFVKRIFLGTVQNSDVAYYANSENYTCDQLNAQINGCEEFIIRTQLIYYAFLATHLYKNDIKWR